MPEEKRYYWLKLKRDFFKRHDIQIVESMPNGKDYVLFYLKLLAESIDHEGALRFNELIPYSEQMLSTITNTNIDIVRSAIVLLKQLDLIEVMDDQTIFVKDTAKMLGEGSSTSRVRQFRERKAQLKLVNNVSETLHETQLEKEKELEIDTEIDKELDLLPKSAKKKQFIEPTVEEANEYCKSRNNGISGQAFIDSNQARGWIMNNGKKMVDWKAGVRTWENNKKNGKYGATSSRNELPTEYGPPTDWL